MSIPAGDELLSQAEEHYTSYRTVTNAVQALILDGPWAVEPSEFGMQPAGAGCPDDSYKFSLTRQANVEPDQQAAMSEAIREYLEDQDYSVETQDLGSGSAESRDIIVREQGDFSMLMVTFIQNGSVLVTATTKCWPGDRYELGDMLFGDATLSQGYLPREESPSDELFFGITPGEPAFRETQSPTP